MIFRSLLLTLLLSFNQLSAQDDNWLQRMQQFGDLTQTEETGRYELGAGDLVEISVFGVDSFNQELRVSSSGKITVPYLGRLTAAGMTGEELENELASRIVSQGLIRDPQVSVFIKEYRSQPIYVLGAVNQPGQYMVTRQLNLLDALTMAGGLNLQKADKYAMVQRSRAKEESPNSESAGSDVGGEISPEKFDSMRIDLVGLLEGGEFIQNVPIEGGDIIQIPERKIELFYVVGEVLKAGAFEIPRDEEQLRATQALSWAGGTGKTAKLSEGLLVRYDETGARQELSVNFKAILKGKEPDFMVHPNDIIFIPGSSAKTLGYGLLGAIPNIVAGAIIWRPF